MDSRLPNVSTILRELSHLQVSGSQDHHDNNYQNFRNYKTDNDQSYNFKQNKHNQLMEKLQRSSEENKKIMNLVNEAYNFSTRTNYQSNNSYSSYPSQSITYKQQQPKKMSYVPKKIKYRHIQDFHNKQLNTQPQSNKLLQRQFYEDFQNTKSIPANTKKQSLKTVGIQYEQNAEKVPEKEIEELGLGSKYEKYRENQDGRSSIEGYAKSWANRQSKYEDKLQSYYQLCKKTYRNPKNVTITKKQEQNNRFVRGQSKNKKMKLEEALGVLLQ